jgi:hypothetical protein
VRCLEDPAVVALLRERRLPLEVCPTSNYRLKVVATAPAPPRQLVDAGTRVHGELGRPPMFGTTLVDEYCRLAGRLSLAELWQLNRARSRGFLTRRTRGVCGALRRVGARRGVCVSGHSRPRPRAVARDASPEFCRRTRDGPHRSGDQRAGDTISGNTVCR